MRKKYASNISPEKFEETRPLLQGVRRRTLPMAVDLCEGFCAMRYLLRTGCRWGVLCGCLMPDHRTGEKRCPPTPTPPDQNLQAVER